MDDSGDRVEVRVYFRQDGEVRRHAEARPCRDTHDAAGAVGACVGATLPDPLAVLAEAVCETAHAELAGMGDSGEARLVDALYAAARDYAACRRASAAPATPEG